MNDAPALYKLTSATSLGRWMGLGPYYAMFPVKFAFEVVETFSSPNSVVLDPFAGRASSIYAAAALNRIGYGIEINPVGWLYGFVKLNPAPQDKVLKRIHSLKNDAESISKEEIQSLPEFFNACYTQNVLRYLLAARHSLKWNDDKVDATVMAIILVDLHGKVRSSLSNQMRQSKAMSPDYSIRWWKDRGLYPPERDPIEFLSRKVAWRYDKGVPELRKSEIILGDSREEIPRLREKISQNCQPKVDLLFTSPPYFGISNYLKDQWIRLWMLGGPPKPISNGDKRFTRFESKPMYRDLLYKVFKSCSELMADNATVYVRTDVRDFTYETTLSVLKDIFPTKHVETKEQPFTKKTQTALYGDKETKPGERDIILTAG